MKALLSYFITGLVMLACGTDARAGPSPRLPMQAQAVPAALMSTLAIAQAPIAKRLQIEDDPPLDDGSPRNIPPGYGQAGDQISLTIEDGQAKVCRLKTGILLCAIVEAPLPQGTMVHYWHLPDGNSALTYTRTPGVSGVPDPNGEAVLRFQAAFNGAVRALSTAPLKPLRNDGGFTSRALQCENEDCVDTDEDRDDDSAGGGGDSGAGGGAVGGGGGGGGGGGARDDIPTVTIRGKPDPLDTIPVFSPAAAPFADTPLLMPRDQLQDVAAVLNPCVVSPIISVCIHGRRPPPPPGEVPLPEGAQPWFPQSWCNWSHVFCSAGQEPADNDRGIDASTSGKTKAELDEICVRINIAEIDVCKAHFPKWRSTQFREFDSCKQTANQRMYACFRTADRLTDFGQHPAP